MSHADGEGSAERPPFAPRWELKNICKLFGESAQNSFVSHRLLFCFDLASKQSCSHIKWNALECGGMGGWGGNLISPPPPPPPSLLSLGERLTTGADD